MCKPYSDLVVKTSRFLFLFGFPSWSLKRALSSYFKQKDCSGLWHSISLSCSLGLCSFPSASLHVCLSVFISLGCSDHVPQSGCLQKRLFSHNSGCQRARLIGTNWRCWEEIHFLLLPWSLLLAVRVLCWLAHVFLQSLCLSAHRAPVYLCAHKVVSSLFSNLSLIQSSLIEDDLKNLPVTPSPNQSALWGAGEMASN